MGQNALNQTYFFKQAFNKLTIHPKSPDFLCEKINSGKEKFNN